MPKTRFDKIARNPLKELVLGRKAAVRISEVNLAKKMGISTAAENDVLRPVGFMENRRSQSPVTGA